VQTCGLRSWIRSAGSRAADFTKYRPGDGAADAWGKFELWHNELSEFSGFDAWSVYTPDELEYVRCYYAPHPDPESLPSLAEVADDVGEIGLTEVKWQTAEVGWEEPRGI
jgi:hypothetical protein